MQPNRLPTIGCVLCCAWYSECDLFNLCWEPSLTTRLTSNILSLLIAFTSLLLSFGAGVSWYALFILKTMTELKSNTNSDKVCWKTLNVETSLFHIRISQECHIVLLGKYWSPHFLLCWFSSLLILNKVRTRAQIFHPNVFATTTICFYLFLMF